MLQELVEGKHLGLKTETLGILSTDRRRTPAMVPQNAIIEVVSDHFNSSRMADVIREGPAS